MPCLPSTTCVTAKSAATLISEYASSRLRRCCSVSNSIMSTLALRIATFRSSSNPWTIKWYGVSSSGEGNSAHAPGQHVERRFDRRAADFAVTLRDMRITEREQRAGHLHGIVHSRAGTDAPIVYIPAVQPGGT